MKSIKRIYTQYSSVCIFLIGLCLIPGCASVSDKHYRKKHIEEYYSKEKLKAEIEEYRVSIRANKYLNDLQKKVFFVKVKKLIISFYKKMERNIRKNMKSYELEEAEIQLRIWESMLDELELKIRLKRAHIEKIVKHSRLDELNVAFLNKVTDLDIYFGLSQVLIPKLLFTRKGSRMNLMEFDQYVSKYVYYSYKNFLNIREKRFLRLMNNANFLKYQTLYFEERRMLHKNIVEAYGRIKNNIHFGRKEYEAYGAEWQVLDRF